MSLAAAALSLVLLLAASARSSQPPNIVIILQDDLGYSDVSFHGGSTLTETSNITALAREGIILERHYTHWHCSPTRRSLLSGRFPIHHGEQLSAVASDDIDLRWTLLSEKLKTVGYMNYWFGKGHTGYLSYQHLPLQRGFDAYLGYLTGAQSYTSSDRWHANAPMHNNTEYSSELYGELAVNTILDHDLSKPLFLYLPFQAVHVPYDPVPGWDGRQCKGYEASDDYAFCGMLWSADRYVGLVKEALRTRGMWENTLIIYTSDNGGVTQGINYPLRGEKHTNWEGGMRTAAFVSGGLIPPQLRGTTNSIVFHVADWYPTVCRLAGVSGRDDPPVMPKPVDPSDPSKDIYGTDSFPPVDGVDIWPFLMNTTHTSSSDAAHAYLPLSKEVLIAGDFKILVAQPHYRFQNNGWKYPNGSWVQSDDAKWPCNTQDLSVDNVLPGVPGKTPCLFNVATDMREMVNLADEQPDRMQDLWSKLNASVLTSFLHGASSPEGNPGSIPRCSPKDLLGPCNVTCAEQYFKALRSSSAAIPGSTTVKFVASTTQADSSSAGQCPLYQIAGICFTGGEVLHRQDVASPDACCSLCSQHAKCTHFTYVHGEQGKDGLPNCHLKTGTKFGPTPGPNCSSGSYQCPSAGTDFPVCGIPGC
eukprot:m.300955 g.300955  ORF g.300955 m.300955 type:complete len:645 (+) comp14569_c0_seq1:3-1937(+)